MFECSQHLRRNIALLTEHFSVRQKSAIDILLISTHATGTNLGNNRVMCERGVGRYRFAHLVPAPW